jgi:hypothetical protein
MSRLKTSLSLSCLATGLLLALAGCASPEPTAGSAQLSVSLPSSLASGDVTHVTVTLSAPDLPLRSQNLALVDGRWTGTFGDIPPGTERTFSVQAFDADGFPLFQGQLSSVTITAGQMATALLVLQEVGGPPPLHDSVPEVRALVASQSLVQPGASLSLEVRAHDPDPGDSLSYSWTAPSGSFSTPSRASTSWTAPQSPGTVSITITITDSRGAQASLSLPVDVGTFPPVVAAKELRPLSSPDRFALYVAGWDPQGTDLTFSWSTNWGSLSAPVGSRSSSRSTWSVPAPCLPEGTVPLVTVSLRNTLGLATVTTFSLPHALPTCTTLGSWAPPPPFMSVPRAGHTSTLLPSGKVLVVCGYGGGSADSAELYDPASHSWSPAAGLPDCGQSLAATLLPSGKVLVTGGSSSAGGAPVSAARLYDPATDSWSPAHPMATARSGHTSTLLPSGKVLVTGGYSVSSAELYDPATDSWSPAGTPASVHHSHTATLLPSGKVLVTGGRSAELYDPASNSWTATGALVAARSKHQATPLLSGHVLVTGGNGDPAASAELYDPATGTWALTGALASARHSHTATLLRSGQVLVAGGEDADVALDTVELYEPATGTFRAQPPMSQARTQGVATLLPSGRVLITGGWWIGYVPDLGSTWGSPLKTAVLFVP